MSLGKMVLAYFGMGLLITVIRFLGAFQEGTDLGGPIGFLTEIVIWPGYVFTKVVGFFSQFYRPY